MANNRLTWQNVATPSFETSASALENAGRMTGSAFDALSAAMAGVDQRQRDALSNQAMAEAMKYTDSAQWMDALKAGGIAGLPGLGTDVSRLNADAMSYLQNRTTDLLGNENTRLDMANTQSLMDNRAVQTEQDKLTLAKDRYNWDRTKTADAATDAQTKRDAQARGILQPLLDAGRGKDEIAAMIASGGYDPLMRKTLFSTLDGVDSRNFQAPADIVGAFGVDPAVTTLTNGLNNINSSLDFSAASPLLDAMTKAQQGTQNGEGADAVMSTLKQLNGYQDMTSDEKTAFGADAGGVLSEANALAQKYGVSPAVVANLMPYYQKEGGLLWGNGKVVPDFDKIEAELQKLNEPGSKAKLDSIANAVANKRNMSAEFSRQAGALKESYTLRYSRAKTDSEKQAIMAEFQTKMAALSSKVSETFSPEVMQQLRDMVSPPAPVQLSAASADQLWKDLNKSSYAAATAQPPAPRPAPSPQEMARMRSALAGSNPLLQGGQTPVNNEAAAIEAYLRSIGTIQ